MLQKLATSDLAAVTIPSPLAMITALGYVFLNYLQSLESTRALTATEVLDIIIKIRGLTHFPITIAAS